MEATPEQHAEGVAVVRVLSAVLERLVTANAPIAQSDGQITKFHALKAPSIGVLQYLERIHKYASCSTECFILALIYIDRLIQRNNFLLTHLNVHRVVISSVLVAAKFFDDAYYNNAYYAKVGGVLVSEINSLEVEFLFRINFALHVTPELYSKYNAELMSHMSVAPLLQNVSTIEASVRGLNMIGIDPVTDADVPIEAALTQDIRASVEHNVISSNHALAAPVYASCVTQVPSPGAYIPVCANEHPVINHITADGCFAAIDAVQQQLNLEQQRIISPSPRTSPTRGLSTLQQVPLQYPHLVDNSGLAGQLCTVSNLSMQLQQQQQQQIPMTHQPQVPFTQPMSATTVSLSDADEHDPYHLQLPLVTKDFLGQDPGVEHALVTPGPSNVPGALPLSHGVRGLYQSGFAGNTHIHTDNSFRIPQHHVVESLYVTGRGIA